MTMKKILAISSITANLLGFGVASAAADWSIDDDNSSLSYVSIKKNHVPETHVIDGLTGSLTDGGKLSVEIDMASVDSGIEIRDTRLREVLFQIKKFATATFTAGIDLSEFEDMEIGGTVESYLDGVLILVGVKTEIDFGVKVTRLSQNRVVVHSDGPILLNAEDLKLSDTIDELKALAKLPSISYAVPAYLSVELTKQ